MAKQTVIGITLANAKFAHLGRPMFKAIVDAGGRAAAERMKKNTEKAGHVRNKDMLDSIGPTKYYEQMGGGAEFVYPQGENRRGQRTATIAYIINYCRGDKSKRNRDGSKSRMGDHFITGDTEGAEDAVKAAMQAESDRLLAEINNE